MLTRKLSQTCPARAVYGAGTEHARSLLRSRSQPTPHTPPNERQQTAARKTGAAEPARSKSTNMC